MIQWELKQHCGGIHGLIKKYATKGWEKQTN
jgi:hypothetical protein